MIRGRIVSALTEKRLNDAEYVANKCNMSRATWYRKLREPYRFTIGDIVAVERLTGIEIL